MKRDGPGCFSFSPAQHTCERKPSTRVLCGRILKLAGDENGQKPLLKEPRATLTPSGICPIKHPSQLCGCMQLHPVLLSRGASLLGISRSGVKRTFCGRLLKAGQCQVLGSVRERNTKLGSNVPISNTCPYRFHKACLATESGHFYGRNLVFPLATTIGLLPIH